MPRHGDERGTVHGAGCGPVMAPRLSQTLVARVKRLLAAGMSQRRIALKHPISRASVGRIATGRRAEGPADESEARGSVGRCPDCGARVRLPCLACAIGRNCPTTPAQRATEIEPLGVNLKDAERGRYDKIRHGQ